MAINRSNINLQTTRGKKMKDFSGDGKITQKDVLIGPRGVLEKEGDKFVAKQYGGSLTDDIKKIKKAGGGMTYQLYGGTSKIRDGNKEVQFYDKEESNGNKEETIQKKQSFYDKGGK